MAKVRIGFSTAFELENELVGIGTDNPTNTLQALGNIRSSNAKAVGVSTFTTFDGFTDTKLSLEGSAGTKQHTTSGEIIIEGEVTVSSGTTYTSGPKNLTVTNKFTLPKKTTYAPTVGSMRFNENLAALEFYTGTEWRAVNSYVDSGNMGRGIWAGGNTPTTPNSANGVEKNMEFINLNTSGSFQEFGELIIESRHTVAMSSRTRGLIKHGYDSPVGNVNNIDYITIASAGNAIDFGDTTYAAWGAGTFSSSTVGIVGGGTGPLNTMCYVTIATTGDALDFGDLSDQYRHTIGYASPTRGIMGTGDASPATAMLSNFDSITIASSGGGTDFGDICYGARAVSACSNTTRGVWMGGYKNSPQGGMVITEIDNTTIASGGQAIKFGTLPTARSHSRSASTNIRAVNGARNGAIQNVDSIEFASGGSTVAFSELNLGRSSPGALSDSHGGLGGF